MKNDTRNSSFSWAVGLVAGLTLALAIPSIASAQLGALGASTPALSATVLGTDGAYDPRNNIRLVVGAAGGMNGTFVDAAGQPIGSSFPINIADPASGIYAHYPRAIYSPDLNSGAGGFLVLWHQDDEPYDGVTMNHLHARIVSYPAGPVGADAVINPADGGSWWVAGAAAAYSPITQKFLVVWQSCCGGASAVRYRMVDLNGLPVGTIVQASGGYGREPGVAWNPANNEFAIGFNGEDATSPYTVVARVGFDGTLLRRNIIHRSAGTYITDMAHNPVTGRNVMVWFSLAGGTFGAETDAAGDVVATGLLTAIVGSYDGLGLSYNPISGTFLMTGHHATSLNVGALELNKRGGRSSLDRVISSTNPQPSIGSFYPRPVASTIVPQWMVTYSRDYSAIYVQGVETISTAGAADVPIGPAPTVSPTPEPSPSPTPTGGCTSPDPFVALGGGVCVNGGWLPPGYEPAPSPTPTPTPTPTSTSTSTGGCTSPDPFAAIGGGVCVNGGWLPPGMVPAPSPSPSPTPAPSPTPTTGCVGPDPFAAIGGGTCVNGGWLPPGMAPATSPTPTPTPTPAPTSTGCTGPDPFAASGGGTCINGGWVPNSALPTTCSGLPDPFTAIGGGVCINGGWVPKTALGGGRP